MNVSSVGSVPAAIANTPEGSDPSRQVAVLKKIQDSGGDAMRQLINNFNNVGQLVSRVA